MRILISSVVSVFLLGASMHVMASNTREDIHESADQV